MINDYDYRQFTNRLAKPGTDIETSPEIAELLHAVVGISGEAGELLDAVKKHWVYGKELDKENVLEECGDLLFYIEQALESIGRTTSEARQYNYEKLRKRYPNGYTNEAAQARADKTTQNFLGDK